MVMFTCSGGLWPPPQSIDILPQISLLLRVFSHGNHSSCCVYSPTDFTEFTELLAACILPQISQNSQNFLLRLFSHRFHRSTQIVWVRRFSHRLHGSTQIVWVPSRGCTCLKCTNRATLVHLLLCWCTSCSGKRQSRAETSAPPEVSSFCVNLCNLWEAFCLLRRPETSATIFRTLTICVNL